MGARSATWPGGSRTACYLGVDLVRRAAAQGDERAPRPRSTSCSQPDGSIFGVLVSKDVDAAFKARDLARARLAVVGATAASADRRHAH